MWFVRRKFVEFVWHRRGLLGRGGGIWGGLLGKLEGKEEGMLG